MRGIYGLVHFGATLPVAYVGLFAAGYRCSQACTGGPWWHREDSLQWSVIGVCTAAAPLLACVVIWLSHKSTWRRTRLALVAQLSVVLTMALLIRQAAPSVTGFLVVAGAIGGAAGYLLVLAAERDDEAEV